MYPPVEDFLFPILEETEFGHVLCCAQVGTDARESSFDRTMRGAIKEPFFFAGPRPRGRVGMSGICRL